MDGCPDSHLVCEDSLGWGGGAEPTSSSRPTPSSLSARTQGADCPLRRGKGETVLPQALTLALNSW